MAKVTLRGRGSSGVVAIWTGEDDAPYFDPLDHLERVKFHSSLAYPKAIIEQTIVLSLPARTTMGTHVQSYDLLAHGLAGQPWVLASLDISGEHVAAVGSIPVQKAVGGNSGSWARWISIGADGTNVMAFEYTVTPGFGATFSAIDIPVTIWVTNEMLS